MEAESLCERAIVIWEATLGSGHPEVAVGLNKLAALFTSQVRTIRVMREISWGPRVLLVDHSCVDHHLTSYPRLLTTQGRFSEAEPLYKRMQKIFETSFGWDHPNVAKILDKRTELLKAQVRASEIIQGIYFGALSTSKCTKTMGGQSCWRARVELPKWFRNFRRVQIHLSVNRLTSW